MGVYDDIARSPQPGNLRDHPFVGVQNIGRGDHGRRPLTQFAIAQDRTLPFLTPQEQLAIIEMLETCNAGFERAAQR
jgi:hypothetical protein